jgi:putative membrane protein
MSLIRIGSFVLASGAFAAAWFGPLPALARESSHMTMHIAVVAVAAPLLALAVAGTAIDPVRRLPNLLPAIPASMIELAVVWAWHAPALHHAAREHTAVFVLEQGSFAAAGLLLWIASIGGDSEQRRLRAGAGVTALLVTSMHMTLLGALFALANRPLFQHAASSAPEAGIDQQLGGVIMLLVGGASYLIGGLALTAVSLRAAMGAAGRRESAV